MTDGPERWVYFIRAGADGPIKIGSSTDPEGRLTTLQTTHWAKLILVGVCAGGFKREYALHEELNEHCLRGEWFAPTKRVLITMAVCLAEDPEALKKAWTRRALDDLNQKEDVWVAMGFESEDVFNLWWRDEWRKSEPGSYGPSDDPAMNGETITEWAAECLTVTGAHTDTLTMREVMDHMSAWAAVYGVTVPWGELSKSKRRYRIQRRLAEVGVAWSSPTGFVGGVLRPVAEIRATGEPLNDALRAWMADCVTVTGENADEVSGGDLLASLTMWLTIEGREQPRVTKTALRAAIDQQMGAAGGQWDAWHKRWVGVSLG